MKRTAKRLALEIGGVLLFLLLALGAIWFLRSSGRSTVLADRVCTPPCWMGIRPGTTSCWGAQSILEEQPLTEGVRFWDRGPVPTITWRFRFPLTDAAGYVYCLDDRVAAIEIVTLGALNLSQALERLGEPEAYWLRAEAYDDLQARWEEREGESTEERQWIQAWLVYPYRDRLVRVDVELPVGAWPEQIELTGNRPVGAVVYLAARYYDSLVDADLLFPEDGETIAERLRPWRGLGAVDLGSLPRGEE